MEYKHTQFCKSFVKTFDFNLSCELAKVNKNKMRVMLYDKLSEVNKHIQNNIDMYALTNSFITNDLIKYKLGEIIITEVSNPRDKIAAAKILLGYDDNIDKTSEFLAVIRAIKEK